MKGSPQGSGVASSVWGHRGLWFASLGIVAGLLVLVALVVAVDRGLSESLGSGGLTGLGLVIALVPPLLWLVFFYLQDRLEPEPKVYVIGVFILGALLARAVGLPVVRDLFRLNHWLYTNTWTHLLGLVLVTGFVQQFLIYAAVRYSVYGSSEFDERVDGIVYATAAALGYVTALNLDYVAGRGGVNLGVGAMRIATAALAQASIAGVMGYMLASFKFDRRPVFYLPLGLVLVAALNGLFLFVVDLVDVRGLSVNPLWGLLVAVAFAAVLLAIVLGLIRRAYAVPPSAASPSATTPSAAGGE